MCGVFMRVCGCGRVRGRLCVDVYLLSICKSFGGVGVVGVAVGACVCRQGAAYQNPARNQNKIALHVTAEAEIKPKKAQR